MNITIAINGEGRGHFSRAIALAEQLNRSHRVTFRAPSHLADELRLLFPENAVRVIPYLAFVQKGFSVDYLKTALFNLSLIARAFRVQARIARELREERTDIVISDFEPFCSRAAKLAGIPVLQLNHPGIVQKTDDWSVPAIISRIVSAYMTARADRTIICSFFGGDVGPIIREELRAQPVSRGDYFVVYQKKMYREELDPVLDRAGRSLFRVFPDPRADYAASLAGCAGLIAPAGHQSISEALALGKPVFVIPVAGQFEQELNARMLRASGAGDYCSIGELPDRLPAFIRDIGRHETRLRELKAGQTAGPAGPWLVADDTGRAVGMVNQFIRESGRRPEWKRSRTLAPLVAALFAD